MALKNIQLRVEEELKVSAEKVLEELGLDMPTAMRLFLKKVVRTKAIPFRISIAGEEDDSFSPAQIREILTSRKEARDPDKLIGPFRTPSETQNFLDSLKRA